MTLSDEDRTAIQKQIIDLQGQLLDLQLSLTLDDIDKATPIDPKSVATAAVAAEKMRLSAQKSVLKGI